MNIGCQVVNLPPSLVEQFFGDLACVRGDQDPVVRRVGTHRAGEGQPAGGQDIARALTLVRRSLLLWLAVPLCWGLLRA